MSEIISEISIYLVVAILLGYTFGWLITKARLKEKMEDNALNIDSEAFNTLKEDQLKCKTENHELRSQNNKILLENSEQKLKIHHLEKLNTKLLKQEKAHEVEMLAFLKEREEMIKKMAIL